MKWYLMAFKKYAEFSGRSRRKEYWMFILFNAIFSYALMAIDYALGSQLESMPSMGFLGIIYNLIVLIPGLALSVRRLHDVNKSGWYLLLAFIPIIGWIWLFVLNVTNGTTGQNEYGDDPKNPTDEINEIGVAQA